MRAHGQRPFGTALALQIQMPMESLGLGPLTVDLVTLATRVFSGWKCLDVGAASVRRRQLRVFSVSPTPPGTFHERLHSKLNS